MEPAIDHLQITVRNLDRAVAFFDRLMPLLGFDMRIRTRASIPEHELEVVELTIAMTSPRRAFAADVIHRRRPGSLHHLAFRAGSSEELDELFRKVQAI